MEWLVLIAVAAVGYLWWAGREGRRSDGAGGSGGRPGDGENNDQLK